MTDFAAQIYLFLIFSSVAAFVYSVIFAVFVEQMFEKLEEICEKIKALLSSVADRGKGIWSSCTSCCRIMFPCSCSCCSYASVKETCCCHRHVEAGGGRGRGRARGGNEKDGWDEIKSATLVDLCQRSTIVRSEGLAGAVAVAAVAAGEAEEQSRIVIIEEGERSRNCGEVEEEEV